MPGHHFPMSSHVKSLGVINCKHGSAVVLRTNSHCIGIDQIRPLLNPELSVPSICRLACLITSGPCEIPQVSLRSPTGKGPTRGGGIIRADSCRFLCFRYPCYHFFLELFYRSEVYCESKFLAAQFVHVPFCGFCATNS